MRVFEDGGGAGITIAGLPGVVYYEHPPITIPEEILALIIDFLDDQTVWKLFALHTAVTKVIINRVFKDDYSYLSGGDSRPFYIRFLLAINRPAVYLELYDRHLGKIRKKALKEYAAKSKKTPLSLGDKSILDKYNVAHKFYEYIKRHKFRMKSKNRSILDSLHEDMYKLLLPTIEKKENVLPTLQEFVCDSKRFKLFRQLARSTFYRDKYETYFCYVLKVSALSLNKPQLLFNVLLHVLSTHDISRLVTKKDQHNGLYVRVINSPIVRALELADKLPNADEHIDLRSSLELTILFADGPGTLFEVGDDSKTAMQILKSRTLQKPLAVPINLAKVRLNMGSDFSELQLSCVIFSGARLSKTIFSNCNLWGSDFEEVECTETYFKGSNMENSNVKNFSASPFVMLFLIYGITKNSPSTEQMKRSLDNFKRFLPSSDGKYFQEIIEVISSELETNKPKPNLMNFAKCGVLHKNGPDRMNITPHELLLDAQNALTKEMEARAKPQKNILSCTIM